MNSADFKRRYDQNLRSGQRDFAMTPRNITLITGVRIPYVISQGGNSVKENLFYRYKDITIVSTFNGFRRFAVYRGRS